MMNPSFAPLRILVADDEGPVLDIYRKVLAPEAPDPDREMALLADALFGGVQTCPSEGYDPVFCGQAEAAVAAVQTAVAEKRPFAVAFLDVRMPPGPDGIWAARKIRDLDPDVEIVIVTAFSDYQPDDIAARVPPAHKLLYLQKPVYPQELAQFARALGAKWQTENQLRQLGLELEQRIAQRTSQLVAAKAKIEQELARRRQLINRLKESEARYRDLFENAHDLIQSVDAEGRFVFVNPAWTATLGYDEKELKHVTLFDIITPEAMDHCRSFFARIMQGQAVAGIEAVFATKKGQSVVVEGNVVPRVLDGKVVATHGFFRDITARRQAEVQLRQAQKMEALGMLAGGIAHDFNNILAGIQGYTELSLMALENEENPTGHLNQVLAASQRAAELVQQILAFSRRSEEGRKPIRLSLVVKEALRLLKGSIPPSIRIDQDIEAVNGVIMADPGQVHQVVMNLATNAYHAMERQGGVLTVRLYEQRAAQRLTDDPDPGPFLCLEVTDTGCGIDPAIRDRIFEPYFTTKEKGRGTGLGLAMVHGIVTAHGGTVAVQSRPGQGTCFRVYLPKLPAVAVEPIETTCVADCRGNETLLVVDDEEALTLLIRQLLEPLGYTVVADTDGQKALDVFRLGPERFGAAILDMVMPGISGLELARRLRQARADLPIVFCTGYVEHGLLDQAKAMPSATVQTKPVRGHALSQTLRHLLDRCQGG